MRQSRKWNQEKQKKQCEEKHKKQKRSEEEISEFFLRRRMRFGGE
jgi:hypothetical protein